MNYLSLALIKANSRIDGTTEDSLLEFYGNSAEATIANLIGRTYANILEEYGGSVPYDIIHAGLMLVDLSYKERTAVSPATMNNVPFSISCKLMPYVKVAEESGSEENTESQKTIYLNIPYEEGSGTITVDWSAYSFGGLLELVKAGNYLIAMAETSDGRSVQFFNIVESWHEAVFAFRGVNYTLVLQHNTSVPAGPGDISCTVQRND